MAAYIPIRHRNGPPCYLRQVAVVVAVTILAGIALILSESVALGSSPNIPPNARANIDGSWECNRGFHEVDGQCVAEEPPANAWPMDPTVGPAWICKRGYRQVGTACEEISIPANAYLNSFGDNWECNRGFRKVDRSCVAVDVPENGHLDYSGNDWECDRPFLRRQNTCVLP